MTPFPQLRLDDDSAVSPRDHPDGEARCDVVGVMRPKKSGKALAMRKKGGGDHETAKAPRRPLAGLDCLLLGMAGHIANRASDVSQS